MTDPTSHQLTRRAFLSVLAAAGAAACSGVVTVDRTSSGPTGSPQPSPSEISRHPTTPATPTTRPDGGTQPFEPITGETYPNAKRIAGRFVEDLTTYEPGTDLRTVVRRAAREADRTFDVDRAVKRAKPLFVRGAESKGMVVYPQLGGLATDGSLNRACVMVVLRQSITDDRGDDVTVTRALDVRLINRDDEWRVEDLADAGGTPVERPVDGLPEVARTVLEDRRIDLPDSARWDIMRGGIDERLLTTMVDLAAVAPYSVAVLQSGHPRNVFATDRLSGHTVGRAVDIWQLAGQPIVLQQPQTSSDAHTFTEAALRDLDVPELGSPWDLDGPPVPGKTRPSFTDAVHADHIHVAFKAA